MGIGPNIIFEYTDISSIMRVFEEMMESDVDAVLVLASSDYVLDIITAFAEVESRGYDRVRSDGSRRGLIRSMWITDSNLDGSGVSFSLRQAQLVRQASHWLFLPVFFHQNFLYGEENVLLGNTQQFAEGFKRRFGREPTEPNAFAANSCLDLRQAIEIAGTNSTSIPTSAEILAGLARISSETVRAALLIRW